MTDLMSVYSLVLSTGSITDFYCSEPQTLTDAVRSKL
jgi:hypothetical protein